MADDPARLIWSLTRQGASLGTGTTITAAGNSGAYTPASSNLAPAQDQITPVDLRWTDDVVLITTITGASGSGAGLIVALRAFDPVGNPFTLMSNTSPYTTPGTNAQFGGRHAGGASFGTYFVAPEWGQIAWTVTGYTFTGVEIALYARS